MPYYDEKTKRYLHGVLSHIKGWIYQPVAELKAEAWITPEPVPFSEKTSGKKRTVSIGESWGELWDCAWFRFTGEVPESAAGKNLVLLIDLSGEACVFDETGCPVRGLTTVSSEFDYSLGRPGKTVVPFSPSAKAGEKIDLWADAGCNDLFGKYQDSGTLKQAHLAICNEEMRLLYYDFEVLHELMQQLPREKARYSSILYALNEAARVLESDKEEGVKKAREILAVELAKKSGDPSLMVSAIGHAHIDLAWLWPIRETIRKGARTFSTVLANMERYPDYIFGASQPQLYQWVKEYYPDLYEKIKQRIQEGRWEVQGAMWVEADTNVSGGEALVRQVLYGKRFFREEFGKDMKILWLPDVFGYSAALPQILKKSGVDYFMTIKLSWNDYNQHPHHTFIWEGLDGSSVLAHMPPEGTYNSSAAPRAIIASEKNFLDKGVSENCLLLYGIGDGGGGPGEEHLERLEREKDLNGLVPVVQEHSLDFFKRIEANASRYKTWHGELYLERHQGTYTTQAKNKLYNRKMEYALRELEFVAAQAATHVGYAYPQQEIEEIWKEILLYQFHDILPGSSIKRVYDESVERYEILLEKTKELTRQAYASLYKGLKASEESSHALVANSLSWDRSEWLEVNGNWQLVKVPAMGYTVVDAGHQAELSGALKADEDTLENDKIQVVFNADGTLKSVWDKETSRHALAGEGNRLAVYEDHGDAWDFPIQYDTIKSQSFNLVESSYAVEGPKAIRTNSYSFGNSKLVQKVILTAGSRRIDFKTFVDWQENNKMLRTSFTANVQNYEAACDIQFGHVKRPTHRNTSWDMAKYEVCAHKWVDISQGDYGVALLNDCKYGHKVIGSTLDLDLLRSPNYPGVQADRGQHEFTYSLYPHEGDHIRGGVIRAGYELNIPLTVMTADPEVKGSSASFVSVDAENVIVEAVKKAEDNDDLIIRLYESYGAGAKAKVKLGFDFKSAVLVDMMEEAVDQTSFDAQKMELSFKPFEIQTLRISR